MQGAQLGATGGGGVVPLGGSPQIGNGRNASLFWSTANIPDSKIKLSDGVLVSKNDRGTANNLWKIRDAATRATDLKLGVSKHFIS